MMKRYLEKYILDEMQGKMAFISGPRQVGKTTLAAHIGKAFFTNAYEYLNWDNRDDRKLIMESGLPAGKKLVIFDEIHKYRHWKNYLKGEYDKHKEQCAIIVTGSARLDIYKKGGDSLLGRYRSYRLHPLSLAEVSGSHTIPDIFKELRFAENISARKELFIALLRFGGFPEVFCKQSDKNVRLWHNERIDRLIKEDIRDIEQVRDISLLQVLAELLSTKIGSLFSMNSLREDLGVTHKTIAFWVDVFERFYYHFRIYPFQSSLIKSLRKEPKLFLWDWSEVKDEGARLENMIASSLAKLCDFLYDTQGYKAKLNYIRDKEQREVDFLVSVDNKPWFCVEVKSSLKEVSAPLNYFGDKLKIPFRYQVVKESGVDIFKGKARIISADTFLSGLI